MAINRYGQFGLTAELLSADGLTPRQAEVLRLMCAGFSDKSIARALDISVNTVGHHVQAIYEAFGVQHATNNRRMLAALLAIQAGLVRVFGGGRG